ncbi:MAG: DUF2283 domain-containing protein [Candidatus Aenigmarchaeota archaeon]|nr:DUF2283 domain-containing protein [Candidatus Aenigmarchaeota archaeon]
MVDFGYSIEGDVLEVFREGEKVDYSVELFEDYFIDIGSNGKIVGLEIINASSALGVDKKDLQKIRKAELHASDAKGGKKIVFILKVDKAEIKSQIMLPALTA